MIYKKVLNRAKNYLRRPLDRINQSNWESFSKLLVKSDGADWVLSSISMEMQNVCDSINIETINHKYYENLKNQCIFFTNKYDVLSKWRNHNNRIAFPYYHGDPSTDIQFKNLINNLTDHHEKISRVQVTHSYMENIILETGIDKNKVFNIPISIDLDLFPKVDNHKKNTIRKELNIPKSAFVIGSFQKDGNGWGEGLTPKLIKGPDIFVETLKILNKETNNVYVLLTGPARGYVKKELDKAEIPYSHFYINQYSNISKYYHALDLYMITSREEGGPRAVLESMASGIPLVTTRVGQAMDIVKHENNGWMVEIEDIEGLTYWAKYVKDNRDYIDTVISSARETAKNNCYSEQKLLWKNFMDGFIIQ